jgi:hypothetical protein
MQTILPFKVWRSDERHMTGKDSNGNIITLDAFAKRYGLFRFYEPTNEDYSKDLQEFRLSIDFESSHRTQKWLP